LSTGEKTPKIDHRKFPRVLARFPVEYTLGEKTVRTRGSTLGGGGLFIEDKDLLPEGAEFVLRFRPARHLPYLEAKARVCYIEPGRGSGVEFTSIRVEDRQLILRLIHHKSANRRKTTRVPLATQIEIEDSMALAFSRDVSVGGLFVETTLACDIGTRVGLRFHLNDGGPVIVAAGEVRYIVPKMGMGVHFLELAGSDRKRIEALVASSPALLPDPAATVSPASQ
jgi:Tfp pilus assembly protein PilZ